MKQIDNRKVDQYVAAFIAFAKAPAGSSGSETLQEESERLWNDLTVEERAEVHAKIPPLKAMVRQAQPTSPSSPDFVYPTEPDAERF